MIAGVILAAGESSRMRRDKALLTYQGRTFLEAIHKNLMAAGIERIIVVLGHHADLIQSKVKLKPAQFVINQDYARGQTSSLQAGLEALTADSPEGFMLCLVDHPAVSPEVMRQLLERFELTHAPVVIPTFQGERGHPVIVGNALFAELRVLLPSQGANIVIRDYRDRTELVDVADRGILIDVDEPRTYEGLETKGRQ
jgi:molybdenum cofactor cytidylyltransferase